MKYPGLFWFLLVFGALHYGRLDLGLWLMLCGALLTVSFVAELAADERRGT